MGKTHTLLFISHMDYLCRHESKVCYNICGLHGDENLTNQIFKMYNVWGLIGGMGGEGGTFLFTRAYES